MRTIFASGDSNVTRRTLVTFKRNECKNVQFKAVCNCDTAYHTQLKQQHSKTCILLAQHIATMSTCS